MWSLGDYTAVATRLEPSARQLADACRIAKDSRVLDVAAGNGNFALAAAARGARVTAADVTPHMLELGSARTRAAGLDVEWVEGDAEALPFADASFDVVASVFGAMFAPRPQRVAAELFRVCRPQGTVAMANYSWHGFLGDTSKLLARYSTPLPFELPSPFEWGDELVVAARFAGLAGDVTITRRRLVMSFGSLDEGLEFWERTNPPLLALRMTQPPERYAECRRELHDLMAGSNESSAGGLELGSTYLEVVARAAS